MDRLKIPLSEIPNITAESLSVVQDAINAGHLETFLVGRRRFARPEAIRAWVDFLEEQSKTGKPIAYRARRPQTNQRAREMPVELHDAQVQQWERVIGRRAGDTSNPGNLEARIRRRGS